MEAVGVVGIASIFNSIAIKASIRGSLVLDLVVVSRLNDSLGGLWDWLGGHLMCG